MTKGRAWQLLKAGEVFASNPEFFVHPLLDFEQRCTVQMGEKIKVTAKFETKGGWKLRGIWINVIETSGAPNRFLGTPDPSYNLKFPPDSVGTIEFGPEHVYRMEPRRYTIWGRDGEPLRVWGNDARPEDVDGLEIPNVEPIKVCDVNGWAAMKVAYAALAAEHEWPAIEDLLNSV